MNRKALLSQLEQLKIAHRDLDDSIAALMDRAIVDQVQIARMKRQKLQVKDRIQWLEDQLTPDIIA